MVMQETGCGWQQGCRGRREGLPAARGGPDYPLMRKRRRWRERAWRLCVGVWGGECEQGQRLTRTTDTVQTGCL